MAMAHKYTKECEKENFETFEGVKFQSFQD
jgi:hypothetical protein